jgi:Transglutaminase-like superfamily
MKKRQGFERFALYLAIILLAANLYVFFTREWESSFYPTSYATLYYPSDVPTIRKWELVDRNHIQLDMTCSKQVKDWNIVTDGKEKQTGVGMKPSFKIDTTFSELHEYTLVPVPEDACQSVAISIRFYSAEFYESLGMAHSDVYIVRSNVPCGEFEQFSVADWTDDYGYVGQDSLAKVDSILHKEVGIRDEDPTFVKMEKLFPFLRKKLQGSGGVPKDDERWMNPWVLYNEMVNGTGKGWCTQNAQVWVFWANRAGIPTRFVFGARTQDNTIVYTGHSWGESYIKEQHRWAFVDLSQGHLYITDKEGQVLNTVELFQLNQHNAFDGTHARLCVDWQWAGKPGMPARDTVVTVPYPLCNEIVRDEFTAHSIFKFRRPPNVEDVRDIYAGFFQDRTFLTANLTRYLFEPPLAYSLYPTDGARTYLIRRALFFGFLAALAWWLILLLRRRSHS